VGYYQERDRPVRVVRKGDIVRCTPGVEHWHGATPDEGVVYLAISGNAPTEWKETEPQEKYDAIDARASVGSELLRLSRDKWQRMADQDADRPAELFPTKPSSCTWAGAGARRGRWMSSVSPSLTRLLAR
jgi:hypothetical protein